MYEFVRNLQGCIHGVPESCLRREALLREAFDALSSESPPSSA